MRTGVGRDECDVGDANGTTWSSGACEGVITAQLPSGLYEVRVEDRHRLTAHIGGGLGRNFVRLLVGDRVVVELSPRDLTRGRIVKKTEGSES